MGTLHAILAEKTKSVAMEQYLNVFFILDTLLHHVGGTKHPSSDDQIHFLGKCGKI